MAKCSLCNEEKEKLQRRSHIIPAFFFRDKSGEGGSLLKPTVDQLLSGEFQNAEESKEEFDRYILCHQCDQLLNRQYEDHVAKVLDGLLSPNRLPVGHDLEDRVVFENVDMGRFKLFLLSILWRASISSRDFYNEVQLDPDREERLRKMLLEGDPGEDQEFPFRIYSFIGNGELPDERVLLKPRDLLDGSYMFVINGLVIIISSKGESRFTDELSGTEAGLKVFKISPEDTKKLIKAYFGVSP